MKVENEYLIFDRPRRDGIKGIIKNVYYCLQRIYYSILYKIYSNNNSQKKKYQVSIIAIFKNEANYLKEWIEFHRIVGINHFYLYNNNSEDHYITVLEPYIEAGIVTLIDWPKNQAQMECYCDGIKKYKNESKWLTFIDIDEFIVPNNTDNIYDFLKTFENRPVVIGYWKYFGASGYINRSINNLVTEDFVVGWNKYADIGKCFYNTSYDFNNEYSKNSSFHHFMWTCCRGHNLPPVNVFGKICFPNNHVIPKNANVEHFPLQINHYFTKSYQEYIEKKSKGDVYFKKNPHTFEYFHKHDIKCQKVDYHAYKYLIKLKLAMSDKKEKKN